jgi:DNA-binding NarL/FixJ family response regulator
MNAETIIHVLIADDHPVVRRGLSFVLKPKYGIKIIGEAEDGVQAVELAQKLKPDVILMDLRMPNKSGLEAIQEILQNDPEARILVLSSFSEADQVAQAIQAGALGYLLKDSSAQELVHAIGEAYKGNLFLPQQIARKVKMGSSAASTQKTEPIQTHPKNLTDRELEVLNLLVLGMSNKKIAEELCVSEVTARFHVSSIIRKLGVSNRSQAITQAIRNKLVDTEDS